MNSFSFKILEDGTISVTTGAFSDEVHLQADQLLEELERMLGGQVQVSSEHQTEQHHHHHHHEHQGAHHHH